jgi:hypothetical protein
MTSNQVKTIFKSYALNFEGYNGAISVKKFAQRGTFSFFEITTDGTTFVAIATDEHPERIFFKEGTKKDIDPRDLSKEHLYQWYLTDGKWRMRDVLHLNNKLYPGFTVDF